MGPNYWVSALAGLGALSLGLALVQPWAAVLPRSLHFVVRDEFLVTAFLAAVIAAFVAGNRAITRRPRYLGLMLVAPLGAIAAIGLPMPPNSSILAGGVWAFLAAGLFVAAIIADLIAAKQTLSAPSNESQKSNAIASLVLGIVGWALSGFALIGLGLGVASIALAAQVLVRTSRPGAPREGRGLAVAGLVLGVVSVLAVPAVWILQYQ